MSEFGDRPQKLIEAFKKLDTKKTGKIPMPLATKLLTGFDVKLNQEELAEFQAEADAGGFVEYERFVKDVIFGRVE